MCSEKSFYRGKWQKLNVVFCVQVIYNIDIFLSFKQVHGRRHLGNMTEYGSSGYQIQDGDDRRLESGNSCPLYPHLGIN